MRKFNITLMLCIAVITACLGVFLFLAEPRGIAYWATSLLSLLAITGSSVGSIPYIMQSMEVDFIAAFDYIWPTLLLGGAIASISYVLAHILITKKSINLVQS